MERVDILEKEKSLPILVDYLNKGIEVPITSRTLVLISRGYLRGWESLYDLKKCVLTLEGGVILLDKWLERKENGFSNI